MTLFVQLWRQRELLMSLVKRDLKVRYKDSVLGFFWSFCRPLFLMMILATVFSLILPMGFTPDRAELIPFPLFLLTGLLPWMYLAGTLADATPVILNNASLIKKVSINSAVFPASVVMGNLVHLVLAFIVYLAFLAYYGRGLTLDLWIILPTLIIQTLFLLSLALLCSALNVFYRDVFSIVELLLTGWFYVTPLLYPYDVARDQIAARFPEYAKLLQYFFLLNPMTPILMAYRRAFLNEPAYPEIGDANLAIALGATAVTSVIMYAIAWRIFRHYSRSFADEL